VGNVGSLVSVDRDQWVAVRMFTRRANNTKILSLEEGPVAH